MFCNDSLYPVSPDCIPVHNDFLPIPCSGLSIRKEEGEFSPSSHSFAQITLPRLQRPHGHCRCRKPCRLCGAGGAHRTWGKRPRRGSPASSGSYVSYLFLPWKLFSWELPFWYTALVEMPHWHIVYFSSSFCSTAMRGSNSFLQSQGPKFKSFPHREQSPLQSSLHSSLLSIFRTTAVVRMSSRSA